jgi:hypothetical protein
MVVRASGGFYGAIGGARRGDGGRRAGGMNEIQQ